MSGRPAQLPHVTCPACGGKAFARSVGKNTPLYREIYYHCRNPDACGHQFVVGMEPIRTTRPSRFPRPIAVLPQSQWHSAANDRAANDDGPPTEPHAGSMHSR
ncbi:MULTISPECIES: ogr/Delta-like zinc finger family protein [unclassified Novosphingobium]|uniref:ogr/Delta-like zinc finger family protein n=1 Tax=unclassified Novosphingobium TaxID=2644732 RepID=UPI0002F4FB21|nr:MULTISPECIES: ogr/Delta-like zinc finger family protein [unclassified Novosphingobium]GFM28125.1 uncharacterized protein PY1_contig-04-173 [Novosphingobium sp. PY1]